VAQQLIVDFVAELDGLIELPEPIVEFGSLQVEPGQPNDLRALFGSREFVGTDLREGPGVDRVEDLRALSFGDGTLGTALCLDTLEHCADPLTACRELHRVVRDGGVCVLSSVMFFPVHGYPHDYWRFTPEGLRLLLEPFDDVWARGVGHPQLPMQVVAVAGRGRSLSLGEGSLLTLAEAQRQWDRAEGKVRFGILHVPLAELGRTLAAELPRAVAQRAGARLRGRP
jgi:SAM-dependent methyltransferase